MPVAAVLNMDNGAGGLASVHYSELLVPQGAKIELLFEVSGLTPGDVHALSVGGFSFGNLTIDGAGNGRVKFSNMPDEVDELLFPDGFTNIDGGASVVIGTAFSGDLVIA